jgi:outer membrane protein OmpA-like peptidoglycan-associated protein
MTAQLCKVAVATLESPDCCETLFTMPALQFRHSAPAFMACLLAVGCSTTHAPAPRATSATPPPASGAMVEESLGALEVRLRAALSGSSAIIERETAAVHLRFPAHSAFAPDQFTLLPAFASALDELAHALHRQEQLKLTVSVYTDATGSETYNQQFSQQRAGVIATYLAAHGIPAHRIIARGGGESAPLPAENTPEGRDLNRRVEFSISALSS